MDCCRLTSVDAQDVQLLIAASAPPPEDYHQSTDSQNIQQLLDGLDIPNVDLSQISALVKSEDLSAFLSPHVERDEDGGQSKGSIQPNQESQEVPVVNSPENTPITANRNGQSVQHKNTNFVAHSEVENFLKSLDPGIEIDISALQDVDIAEALTALQDASSTNQEQPDQQVLDEENNMGVAGVSRRDLMSSDQNYHDAYKGKAPADVNTEQNSIRAYPLNSESQFETTQYSGNDFQARQVPQTSAPPTNNHTIQISEPQGVQVFTDVATRDLMHFNNEKLIALQNTLKEVRQNEPRQSLPGLSSRAVCNESAPSTDSAAPISERTPQNLQASNQADDIPLDLSEVNVEEIPQEAILISLGKLFDTTNVDMSSISLDNQTELAWLAQNVKAFGEQDGYREDAEAGDDRGKSTATQTPLGSAGRGENLGRIRKIIQPPKRMSAKNNAEQARIREENRERKKRWRESNQDRNKDNDLRCRVSKRAAKLYGPVDTDEKKAWMEAEFNKRKEKREAKEKARCHDDHLSTSQCFPSYPQHQHNHSGGTSATFSANLQPLSRSSADPPANYASMNRNRACSVAESTSSAGDIGERDDTDGALKLLSDPEAAQKLLENSEAMKLLSSNPEVLAILQSVIEGRMTDECAENDKMDSPKQQLISDHSIEPINVQDIQVTPPPDQQQDSQGFQGFVIGSTSTDSQFSNISELLNLSESELVAKLAQMDQGSQLKILEELLELKGADFGEGNAEAANKQTPTIDDMELSPDVQKILDAHRNGTLLDLNVVNDRLNDFAANIQTDDFTSSNSEDWKFDIKMSDGLPDIGQKLRQALQDVLGENAEKAYPPTPTYPAAPPSTPAKTSKRAAPFSDESSSPRKRHQQSSGKPALLPEISPSTARALADILHNSGIDLSKLGISTSVTTSITPPTLVTSSAAASGPSLYSTGPIPRPALAPECKGINYAMASASNPPNNLSRPMIPRPPVNSSTTSNGKPLSAAAAHAASFGNSAGMNQRFMHPPAYRPHNLGIGYGGINLTPTVQKKKPDERIVKAMGFPPLMAGLRKKPSP